MEKLLQEVLKRITPTEEEHKREEEIVREIFQELKKFKEVKPLLVGSLAKRTDISTNKDIDIFIKFHPQVPRDELEKKGLLIGKDFFKKLKADYEIDYAEHPYVTGSYRNYSIEIVPCYAVKGKPKSAVDRTPFHTQYIQKKLRERRSLQGEIRLLKQFMRGVGVYGAEAKVEGFSGYLIELLVLSYGSFQKVLEKAKNWQFPQILDPKALWKKDKKSLKYFFSEANLIVVDPVDKDRNVAAAVSEKRLSQFMTAAGEFLKKPQEKFFFPPPRKPPPKEELRKRLSSRETKVTTILFSHSKINPNSLYSQLRKTKNSISKAIHEKKFRILKSEEWSNEQNKSVLIFELEVWSLPEMEHWLGPPVDMPKEEQEKFLKKYKHTYVKGKRLVTERKRKFKNVKPLIIKILKEKPGFGKNLRQVKVELLSGDEIIKKLSQEKDFLIFLGDFLKTP